MSIYIIQIRRLYLEWGVAGVEHGIKYFIIHKNVYIVTHCRWGRKREVCGKLTVKLWVFVVSYVYKWKNHFYKMKGDVGMSVHEKERKQEDAYTKTQTHS